MCDVKSLFCKYGETFIEGYLGNSKECEILFVLKEPDAKEDDVRGFWFKEDILGKKPNNPYHKAFGIMASSVLNDNDTLHALNRCAFINVFPFCGEKSASDQYKSVLNELSKARPLPYNGITKKSDIKVIASNRRFLIDNIRGRFIITTCDIFEALICNEKHVNLVNGFEYRFEYDNHILTRVYKATEYKGKVLIACYHPSYQRAYRGEFRIKDGLQNLIASKPLEDNQ